MYQPRLLELPILFSLTNRLQLKGPFFFFIAKITIKDELWSYEEPLNRNKVFLLLISFGGLNFSIAPNFIAEEICLLYELELSVYPYHHYGAKKKGLLLRSATSVVRSLDLQKSSIASRDSSLAASQPRLASGMNRVLFGQQGQILYLPAIRYG